jgi:hypothetical protein
MNISTLIIGPYVITDSGRNVYTLANQETGKAIFITKEQYTSIIDRNSVEMCNFVMLVV